MITRICFFILCSTQLVGAQKIVQKTILNSTDIAIDINATDCYQVVLNTSKTNEIIVEAIITGEYKNNLSLNVFEEGSTLLIGTSFNVNFELPNDKLSAHKVQSIALNILIPEHLKVNIHGTSSNIKASGVYDFFTLTLNDGKCELDVTAEKTNVQTQSGIINLYANTAKNIAANSSYGKVYSDDIPKGFSEYKLNTITGDIHIYKTK